MLKPLLSILIVLFYCFSSFAEEKVTLDQVVDVVSDRNYQVLESAERVFQARAEISVARANLLPKLNFWTIVKTIVNPASLVETLLSGESGIAPFLVPNNWFRLKESQILYDAERESYRGVWSNEVRNAKAIYVNLLLDLQLFNLISEHVSEIESTYKIAQTRATLGTIPVSVAQELEIRWLKLSDDKEVLSKLLIDEYKALSYVLGIPFDETLKIEEIAIPDIKNLEPLKYSDFEFRAIDSSPEKRQLDHLLRVIPYLKKEVKYNFFGNSKASRGVAGGIFDDIPISDGWSFGNGASLRIIEGKERMLSLQKTGIIEVIKRQLNSVIEDYNLSINRYPNVERRLNLSGKRVNQYLSRLRVGQDVDLIELTDAYHRNAFEKMDMATLEYRFVVNKDKFHRLIFHGDYKKAKESLEQIDKDRKEYLKEKLETQAEEKRKSRDERRRRS